MSTSDILSIAFFFLGILSLVIFKKIFLPEKSLETISITITQPPIPIEKEEEDPSEVILKDNEILEKQIIQVGNMNQEASYLIINIKETENE